MALRVWGLSFVAFILSHLLAGPNMRVVDKVYGRTGKVPQLSGHRTQNRSLRETEIIGEVEESRNLGK